MKMHTLILITSTLIAGCSSTSNTAATSLGMPVKIQQASHALADGDLYGARSIVKGILDADPQNEEAAMLMAEIIDQEIAQEKAEESKQGGKVVDEYTDQEKKDAVKTWLERSKTLLGIRQYNQALFSAEQVFTYDPDNVEASLLIDEIKKQAIEDGKEEQLAMRKMVREEIQDRVGNYLQEARNAMDQNRKGAARFALQKALLLDPENDEALKLYESVKTKKV